MLRQNFLEKLDFQSEDNLNKNRSYNSEEYSK